MNKKQEKQFNQFFDDENNIKWKTTFMSEKEEITIFKDSIRIWNNRYDSDDDFYALKDRTKTLDRESRLLKAAHKKWKLEFKNAPKGAERIK